MKCQNCGKSEVNFHYSSNVNGCVTETHLCSECAAKAGYDMGEMLDFGSIFDRVFPMQTGISGFLPMLLPVFEANAMTPFTIQPHVGNTGQESTCECDCGKTGQCQTNVEIDEEMSKRRELNMQMQVAVENEEFEKAAELRDKIRELEAGGEQ